MNMESACWNIAVVVHSPGPWYVGLYTGKTTTKSCCPQLTTHLQPGVTTYNLQLQSQDSKGSIFHSPAEWPSVALICAWNCWAKLQSHFCQNGGLLLPLTASHLHICAGPLLSASPRVGQKGGGLWDPPGLVKWTAILAQWSVKRHQHWWPNPAVQ